LLDLYQTTATTRQKSGPVVFTRSAAGSQRLYLTLPGRRDIPDGEPSR